MLCANLWWRALPPKISNLQSVKIATKAGKFTMKINEKIHKENTSESNSSFYMPPVYEEREAFRRNHVFFLFK